MRFGPALVFGVGFSIWTAYAYAVLVLDRAWWSPVFAFLVFGVGAQIMWAALNAPDHVTYLTYCGLDAAGELKGCR